MGILNKENIQDLNAKQYVEDYLNSENAIPLIGNYFDNVTEVVDSLIKAISEVIENENKTILAYIDAENQSHQKYLDSLSAHKEFLESLLINPNTTIDSNEILKMINRILDDIKEERIRFQEANERSKKNEREENTKRLLIGGTLATVAIFGVTLLFNRGNISKMVEQTQDVIESFKK